MEITVHKRQGLVPPHYRDIKSDLQGEHIKEPSHQIEEGKEHRKMPLFRTGVLWLMVHCCMLQAAEGVVAVVTAADVPGTNSFIADSGIYPEEVSIFCLVHYQECCS